ncbi:hypothetical protein AB1Y20_018489 [Prymnesium parvum]|uniref:PPPDE domain-containing protein n=1 Tax=Prymnesium parvum TaxID=97485 RepID=A0AB34JRW2_PRYPA
MRLSLFTACITASSATLLCGVQGARRLLRRPSVAMCSDGERLPLPPFLTPLWKEDAELVVSMTATRAALADRERVIAVVYDIGGPINQLLSLSIQKPLPLSAHVSIRLYGKEIGYDGEVEVRPVEVMEEMMSGSPRVFLDLGPPKLSEAQLDALVQRLTTEWTIATYNIFERNCNHFGAELAALVASTPPPPALFKPVCELTENLLDALPPWRQQLGRAFMQSFTVFAIVAWSWATKGKKDRLENSVERSVT